MRRRAFIAIGCGALIWPLSASGQPMKRVPRLCFLTFDPGTPQSPAKRFEAFFEGLRDLGYVHGQTITIDYLHPEGRSDRYPELAAECLHLKPDIIAVTTTPGAKALKNATSTIPIVMVALGDPVGTKLVDSLNHPGGNITGMSQMTSGLAAKRLELLKEAVPELSRVLMAYDVTDRDLHRSAANYVDKILKGARPSDLAVQQPTKFKLVINLRTAKSLGLTIPPSLLARADEVI